MFPESSLFVCLLFGADPEALLQAEHLIACSSPHAQVQMLFTPFGGVASMRLVAGALVFEGCGGSLLAIRDRRFYSTVPGSGPPKRRAPGSHPTQ